MEFADVFYWKTLLAPPLLTFGATYGIFSQWIVRNTPAYALKAIQPCSIIIPFQASVKLATDVFKMIDFTVQ